MVEANVNQLLSNYFLMQSRGNQMLMNVIDALIQQNDTLQKAYENAIKELDRKGPKQTNPDTGVTKNVKKTK